MPAGRCKANPFAGRKESQKQGCGVYSGRRDEARALAESLGRPDQIYAASPLRKRSVISRA
jgi:hypothetical protein